MKHPLRSLASFLGAFTATWLAVVGVEIFGFEAYEAKWSPGFNFALEAAGLLVLLPVAAISFLLGSCFFHTERDPWVLSLAGGSIASVIVAAIAYASRLFDSDAFALILVWGTLCLASGLVGALSRGLFARSTQD